MFGLISKKLFSKVASSVPRESIASGLKKSVLPNAGIRRQSPFAVFFSESFKKDPKTTNSEQMKALSVQWKSLSVNEKEKYAEKSKEQHEQQLKDFSKLSTEEQNEIVEEVKEKKAKKVASKKRRERREKNKSDERPAVPPNAYALFVKDKITGSGGSNKEKMKESAAEWKTLGHVEKQKYTDAAKKLSDEYVEKLNKWKQEMKKIAESAKSSD